ncbi:non-specific lipid transfer protein GPI-anchored 16-like isoform X3 [Fagus crenata]
METIKGSRLIAISATLLVISAILVKGQISTPCTTSMINSFTPCFNFITGSSNNGSSPTSECCSALQSLTSTNMDCACLLVTANVPFQLPINRALALSLPGACNINGVLVQCKSSGTPLPSPGPASFGPTSSHIAASPFSATASMAVALAPAPQSETTLPLTPASPPVEKEAPPTNPGIRPVFTPSASAASYIYVSPASLLVLLVGVMVC